jgi:rhamnosyl/mannosyltransferase
MDLVHFATGHGRPTDAQLSFGYRQAAHLAQALWPFNEAFSQEQHGSNVVASPNYLASSEVLKPFCRQDVVIPYGLDQSAYPKASTETLSHWRKSLPEKFFLFVGVLRYYKGLDSLLRA